MYDGLLKLALPGGARLVAFAENIAVVIVAKHLEEINFIYDMTYEKIRRWMDTVRLKLAEYKTETVLINSRNQVETITLLVGDHEVTSQPYLRYLGVMMDNQLNFKQQAEHIGIKASGVRIILSRLMPNVGGPKQRRIVLLSSVVTSVLTYGIAIWADAQQRQESRRKVAPVYRLSALRVTSAYRTVSEDAVCIIAGRLPIEVLTEERRSLYRRNGSLSSEDLKTEERRNSIHQWQLL
ncbi:uncharacterized protein LOC107044734 [Diachasma alloeum]|uniref:uncharacterized protein LOC107044734 n=1 Tax=Diachasma alloeum TaxID=454923 RepID=UPI0007384108|nr:uncharacterized protein LOC107044734 [Diachasma alloeum]